MNKPINHCRSCGNNSTEPILSLGNMPLANSLLKENDLSKPEPRYPLELVFCPKCSLVQINETVPPEILFSEYLYFSSFSETMLKHSMEIASSLIRDCKLNKDSLVVEIGSNDGYLLQYFVKENIQVLGIEPARNICKVALEKGIRTICEFFNEDVALKLRKKYRADVILINNVLAHVADLNGLVKGIRTLLKEDGQAVIEAPYVKDMIDKTEFDTIYHEHLCYFSVTSLDALFKQNDLLLADVQRIPIHGGSLRIFVGHKNRKSQSNNVYNLLKEEADWGVNQLDAYLKFGRAVEKIRETLLYTLNSIKQKGMRIAAYGAAAKGTVLLNYCNIGTDTIDFVVDLSPYKQGHYIPGVRIPIKPPDELLAKMPAFTVLLVWNIKDEILKQQSEYRGKGGKFIVPLPELEIV